MKLVLAAGSVKHCVPWSWMTIEVECYRAECCKCWKYFGLQVRAFCYDDNQQPTTDLKDNLAHETSLAF